MSPTLSRRTYLAAAGLVAAGSAAGLADGTASAPQTTAPLDASGWPQFQADAGNTGSRPVDDAPGADLGRRWSVGTGGPTVVSQPAVDDDAVYVAMAPAGEDQDAGTVAAVAASDGTVRWTAEAAAPRAPAVADGTVYVADGTRLRALDAATGAERWSFARDGAVSTPVLTASTVFVALPKTLYALDRTSGSVQWSFALAGDDATTRGAPAAGEGTVLLTTGTDEEAEGDLYALDGRTGEPVWAGDGRGTPVLADGTVYVRTAVEGGVALRALDAGSGEERWRFETGRATLPAVAGDTVSLVAGDTARELVELDAATGAVVWRARAGDGAYPALGDRPPVAVDDVRYLGTPDGLLVVDGTDGLVRDRVDPGGAAVGSPAVADGTVYVGTRDRSPPTLSAFAAGERGSEPDGADGDTGAPDDDCDR